MPALLHGSALRGSAVHGSTQRSIQPSSAQAKPDVRAILGQLPIIFEPNQGQADSRVKFLAQGAGYGLFLDASGATLSVQTERASSSHTPSSTERGQREQQVRMKLVGANPAAATTGTDLLPGKSSYFIGNDPHKWQSGIPQFGGVRYASIYPGIDLIFYGNQGHLEYDFQVAPGADPAQAELQFEGAAKLKLSNGDLLLAGSADGGLRLRAPQIYQRDGDRRQPVAGRFVLRAGNRVGFAIGPYDRSRELIIDPQLVFSTYFGGSGSETYPSVAVNGDGNIYLVGSTQGSPANTFPTTVVPTLIPSTLSLTTTSPSHIFVAKITPSQPPVVDYLTFVGGSGSDTSVGVGVDFKDFAYIAGNTTSLDFPTTATAYQTVPTTKGSQCPTATGPCTSVFVTVLNESAGSSGPTAPVYSSYLSGTGDDVASGMTIDLSGDAFVTGTTTSTTPADQPTVTNAFPATYLPVPFQSLPVSNLQFFATKVNTNLPGGASIAYSTLFGGGTPSPAIAVGGGIAVDSIGNMFFSGTTNFYNSGLGQYGNSSLSTDFPVLNSYQPCLDTPPPTVLNNPNPCSPPAFLPPPAPQVYPTDAFVAKINPNAAAGSQLLFSTYLGGTSNDTGAAIALNSGATSLYLTGSTNSSNFVLPTGIAAFQTCLGDPPPNVLPCVIASPAPTNAYVAQMSNPLPSTSGTPSDVALTYFSYLGGSGTDGGLAIAVDSSNDALLTGSTTSTNFPVTPGAIQSHLGTGATQNAFFAQIDTSTVTGQTSGSYVTYFGGNAVDRGTSIAIDPSQSTYFAGDTTSSVNFPTENALQTTLNGPSDAFVVKLETVADACINCVVPVVSPAGVVSAGNQVTVTYTVANQGPDPATNITVTGQVSQPATFSSASAAGGTCSTPSGATVVCQILTLQAGSTSTVTFTVVPTQQASYQVTATAITGNNTNTSNTSTANFTAGGFSLSISPASQTIVAGQTAAFSTTLFPQPVFGALVSLSCGSLPTGAKCNFTSNSISLNGPQSPTLNLTTTPQPVPIGNARRGWRSVYALWLMVPGLAVFGLGAGGKRRGRLLSWIVVCMLFALVSLLPSCGSTQQQPPVSGTPSGTYSLTVTATSGSYSKSVPFSLTVTP